jgi:hypothetical protein
MMGEKKPEANKLWQVWTAATPDAVYYRIQDSRGTDAAEAMLGGFAGIVMCDGYKVYSNLAKRQPGLILAHCWAHIRREYKAIEDFFPKPIAEVLALVDELFAIERLCPQAPEGHALRRQLRAERSRPIVAKIQQWALSVETLPASGLAKAIAYMGGLWTGLCRFLDDPRIPLDNNLAERENRRPVLGRKNHYGSRSLRGTEVAALFYSLCESACLNGLDPQAYLEHAACCALRGETIPLPHELRADVLTPPPDTG